MLPSNFFDLDRWVGEILLRLGLPVTLVVIGYGAAAMLDRLPEGVRQPIGRWVLAMPQAQFNLADALINGFDKLFGVRAWGGLSWPSLRRSFAVSLVTSAVAIAIFLQFFSRLTLKDVEFGSLGQFLASTIAVQGKATTTPVYISVTAILIAMLLINPIVDYFAYMKTRIVLQNLRFLARSPRFVAAIISMSFIILVDFALTTALILAVFPSVMRAANIALAWISGKEAFSPFPTIMLSGLLSTDFFTDFFSGLGKTGFSGAFVYATYATSLWIWLVFAGCIVGRILGLALAALWPVRTWLDTLMCAAPFRVTFLLFCLAALPIVHANLLSIAHVTAAFVWMVETERWAISMVIAYVTGH